MQKTNTIAVLGAGNMGGAIVNGIIHSGYLQPNAIRVADPRDKVLKHFSQKGVHTFSKNTEAAAGSDIVIVAVKPYHIEGVMQDLKPVLNPSAILVSIVTGIRLKQLESLSSPMQKIVRVMPNTAIAIQQSMTCIAANETGQACLDTVKDLFDQLGKTIEIGEELMAAATVLASCGTAFALRYVRAAMQGGIEMGFGAETAQFITAQTVLGAVELLLNTGNHPEREIDKVTTPRGITITGINEMEHQGFSSSVIQGLIASFNKMEQA
ncbi:MAG: pyrroline-5-carboxylate reductase [Mangrovibacterium sp.]